MHCSAFMLRAEECWLVPVQGRLSHEDPADIWVQEWCPNPQQVGKRGHCFWGLLRSRVMLEWALCGNCRLMLLTAKGCGQEEWALGCCPTPLHARASLPSTSVLRIACRKRNDVPLYPSKLSQEGLALQFVVFSPSQICVNVKGEGNSGSCTHQRNQVSQTPCKIYQTKEMCMISAFHLLFLVERLCMGV